MAKHTVSSAIASNGVEIKLHVLATPIGLSVNYSDLSHLI